jgi:DNA (cytosine-5)-methyltransferase 1
VTVSPADMMDMLDFESAARLSLAESVCGGPLPGEINVDLFAGGGGATQGMEDAGLLVHECVNHSEVAVLTHARNHPRTNHRLGDVWAEAPGSVIRGADGKPRPVGVLWASPDCRHFSRARGAAPVSGRVRSLAWVVIKWARELDERHRPRIIMVENVPEFLEWGPTRARTDEHGRAVRDAQGRTVLEPVPGRKGQTFRRWAAMLRRLGYKVEWRVMDAADFGAACRRKRLYVIARRDGHAPAWPEASAARGKAADARCAADVIDWTDLGRSIFERERPLADKTLARIGEGIRRYVINSPRPFCLRVTQTGGGWHVADVLRPMPTQTTRQDLAVVTPVLGVLRRNGQGRDVQEPMATIAAGGMHQGLVCPMVLSAGGPTCRAVPASEPMGTVLTRDHRAVAMPVIMHNTTGHTGGTMEQPLPTVTTGGQSGLVCPVALAFYGAESGGRDVLEPLGTVTTHDRHGIVAAAVGEQTLTMSPEMRRRALAVAGLLVRLGVAVADADGLVYVSLHDANQPGLVVRRPMVDILFRMLKPRELAAAMGFPETYIWPATQREAVRLIGNAVSPVQAAALVRANLPRVGARVAAGVDAGRVGGVA